MKTRGYVALAKKLDKPKQHLIMTAGVSTIDFSSVDDEEGEDGVVTDAAKDPRAFLEIWYVLFRIFKLPMLILLTLRFESLICRYFYKRLLCEYSL